MTAREKIDFVIRQVKELARLNPANAKLSFELSSVYFHEDESLRYIPDDAPLQLSVSNQIDILNKFQYDGLISNLDIALDDTFAYFTVSGLDIDSEDNPYSYSKSGTVLSKSDKTAETDIDRGILVLRTGQTVFVAGQSGRENNALRLLKTLMKEPEKQWSEDEILEDWEGENAIMKPNLSERIYNSYKSLEKKVFEITDIDDFVGVRNKTYRLNTKYLDL